MPVWIPDSGKKDWIKSSLPPSSSASVSDSSLSTSLLSWMPRNSLVQIMSAVSAPPTVRSTESLCSHCTLVTCALCPTYFLNLACWPYGTENPPLAAWKSAFLLFLSHHWNKHTSYLHWVGEELYKPKIISCGQEGSVLCETGRVDNSDIAVHGPDSLTGGTKHACPGVPFNLLYLQTKFPQRRLLTLNIPNTHSFHVDIFLCLTIIFILILLVLKKWCCSSLLIQIVYLYQKA